MTILILITVLILMTILILMTMTKTKGYVHHGKNHHRGSADGDIDKCKLSLDGVAKLGDHHHLVVLLLPLSSLS